MTLNGLNSDDADNHWQHECHGRQQEHWKSTGGFEVPEIALSIHFNAAWGIITRTAAILFCLSCMSEQPHSTANTAVTVGIVTGHQILQSSAVPVGRIAQPVALKTTQAAQPCHEQTVFK